jgi:hypothetical protein
MSSQESAVYGARYLKNGRLLRRSQTFAMGTSNQNTPAVLEEACKQLYEWLKAYVDPIIQTDLLCWFPASARLHWKSFGPRLSCHGFDHCRQIRAFLA